MPKIKHALRNRLPHLLFPFHLLAGKQLAQHDITDSQTLEQAADVLVRPEEDGAVVWRAEDVGVEERVGEGVGAGEADGAAALGRD